MAYIININCCLLSFLKHEILDEAYNKALLPFVTFFRERQCNLPSLLYRSCNRLELNDLNNRVKERKHLCKYIFHECVFWIRKYL